MKQKTIVAITSLQFGHKGISVEQGLFEVSYRNLILFDAEKHR